MPFVLLSDLLCENFPQSQQSQKADAIRQLIQMHLLPVYNVDCNDVVLKSDLNCFAYLLASVSNEHEEYSLPGTLFSSFHLRKFNVSECTTLISPLGNPMDSAFYSATRRLMSVAHHEFNDVLPSALDFSYFPPTRLRTMSASVKQFADNQVNRSKAVSSILSSQFANTAYYMGSKRAIRGFIIDAMSHITGPDGIVLDLMCGSGSASSGFCKYWPTFASDIQQFCTCLAKVQGGGYSRSRASATIDKILPNALTHVDSLMDLVGFAVADEDKLFHRDVSPDFVKEYSGFVKGFPTYPNNATLNNWNPTAEVERRRNNPMLYPYCLFTTYFANMFFGIRQCVEIDSIRYAISRLSDADDKAWALGALVATVSSLATTYAGHFAQPPYASPEMLNETRLLKLIEKRVYPITQEFCVRLKALGEESEQTRFPVTTVAGPWDAALDSCKPMLSDRDVSVYLDAPYTRDEYSRYYHVLETLVKYNYPSALGKGKTPSKRDGERVRSEFFTRNISLMEYSLSNVISSVLKLGWNCLWSYADAGDANIASVITQTINLCDCSVSSYTSPHHHQSHRGRGQKDVLEYAVTFIPNLR